MMSTWTNISVIPELTETIFFILTHIPSTDIEEAGFMTLTSQCDSVIYVFSNLVWPSIQL